MKGLLIAASNMNAGKTIISLALMRALKNNSIAIATAKAGADFIDPLIHQAASLEESINLDSYAMRPDLLSALSARHSKGGKTLIIDGARALFDGAEDGSGSTASLAKILNLPVILLIDCNGQSQSIAALVKGYDTYMPNLYIAGLILNKVIDKHHAVVLQKALEPLAMPILGIIYQNPNLEFPTHQWEKFKENSKSFKKFIENAAKIIDAQVDLAQIIKISTAHKNAEQVAAVPRLKPLGQHIAIAKDEAFCFYYKHLLAGFLQQGAEISTFSPLKDEKPNPLADAIYFSAGCLLPYAEKLATNSKFKQSIKEMANKGALIYGEGGGYAMLGESLKNQEGTKYTMLGLLPVKTSFAENKNMIAYRLLKPNNNFIWQGKLRGVSSASNVKISEILNKKNAKFLFETKDCLFNDLGKLGLQINNVAGSNIHVIDREN